MLLVIMATIVCGKPVFRSSGMTTSAGRRFAVRRFESGNRTSTTSPYLKVIVRVHFRTLPIVLHALQPRAKVGCLLGGYSARCKLDRTVAGQKCDDHASFFSRRRRLEKLDLAVAIDAFDGSDHDRMIPHMP